MTHKLPRLLILAQCLRALSARADGPGVHLTELHPAPPGERSEFIELYNASPRHAEVGGWTLDGDVSLVFPPGWSIEPFTYLVLASDPDAFRAEHGFPPAGRYAGLLPEDAGALALRAADGVLVTRVAYAPGEESAALGGGASLELISPELDGADGRSWQPSRFLGGTPGADNSRARPYDVDPVVTRGTSWRYFKGTAEPPGPALDWTLPGYDDAAWPAGPAPFGFGNADDATVLDDMQGTYTNVYLRRVFRFRSRTEVLDAVLWAIYDDGFIAYLNGVEVLRRNMGDPHSPWPHDAPATERRQAEGTPEEHRLVEISSALRAGDNVLAIQAANDHVRGNDFAIHAALTVTSARRRQEAVGEVIFNEASFVGDKLVLEVFNPGTGEADLDGCRLLVGPALEEAPAPAGLRVPPRGFAVFDAPTVTLPARVLLAMPASGRRLIAASAFIPEPPAGAAIGRFPDGRGRLRLLPRPTPTSPNAPTVPRLAAITEIHYHPLDPDAEFIEVEALEDVDLGSWELAPAVRFVFPAGTRLRAGERIAVARDPARIPDRGTGASITGPFRGRLANDAEEIRLLDAQDGVIDAVRYADDGSWPQEADGLGSSLELVDSTRENEVGAAWRASRVAGGTPGAPNSVADAGAPPLITHVRHEPVVPGPGDEVRVIVRVEPFPSPVDLLWRRDGEDVFQRHAMSPDGDMMVAVLPALTGGTVVELAVEAAAGGRMPAGEPGSYLYQVDGARDSPFVPTYRLILRARDLAELRADVSSEVPRPATFVAAGRVYQDATVRYRGNGSRFLEPKSYRVRFTEEHLFEGRTVVLLNGHNPERQVLGMDLWRRAGMPYSRARMVGLILNGERFPLYADVEPIDEDYLERQFGDAAGNLYRGRRTADFTYLGEPVAAYRAAYEKHTNFEAGDWSDVIALARAFSLASDEEFPAAVSALIDVDEWLRWLAINSVLSNQEGGLHRDTGDDYFLYRPVGGRFVLLPWDMDSTFIDAAEPLQRPTVPAIRRLIAHPAFAPRYWRALLEVVESHFGPASLASQIASMEISVPAAVLDEITTFVKDRAAFVRDGVPSRLRVIATDEVWGAGDDLYCLAEAPLLEGEAPVLAAAKVLVGGRQADYAAWSGRWSAPVRLRGGEERIRIEATDEAGLVVESRDLVIRRVSEAHLVAAELPAGVTEWPSEGSPYVVARDLEVGAGSELVIRPGARVLFPQESILRVKGRLRAVGTAAGRITFEGGGAGRPWRGLRFAEGSVAELEGCDFAFADGLSTRPALAEPFIAGEKCRLVIRDCTFRYIPGAAIDVLDGFAEVRGSSFLATGEAIHGARSTVIAVGNLFDRVLGNADAIDLDADPPSSPEPSRIEANTIVEAGDDGIDLLDSSALIRANLIIDCGDRGISIEGPGSPRVEWNVVDGCATGIALKDGSTASGEHDTVTRCGAGIHVFIKNPGAAGPRGELHSSIVWGNGRDAWADSESSLQLDHCDVGEDPAAWGPGNLAADPLFAGLRDHRLLPGSPCEKAGRDGSPAGARGVAQPAAPEISAVEPAAGSARGGDLVLIRGTRLEGLLEATLGGRALEAPRVLASGAIAARTPAAARAGPADLVVRTSSGSAARAGAFRYARDLPRGDADGDLKLSVTDAVRLLESLFRGGPPPACAAVGDLTGDGRLLIDDVLFFLRYLFGLGPPPGAHLADCE